MSDSRGERGRPRPRVAVVADDLIWGTRIADGLRRAGADPVSVRSAAGLTPVLGSVAGCVVDLTARAYDPMVLIHAAAAADGVAVIAVGPHDDAIARRAAREAGAARVYAYRALFEHGDRELSAWVASFATVADVVR